MRIAALLLAATLLPAQAGAQSVIGGGAAQALYDRGDRAGAAALWRAQAEDGSAEAAWKLAQMLDLGLGVGRDPQAAARWFEVAARRGLPEAQFDLGVLHDGAGRARQAARWYAHAAAAGHARAQYNLALLFDAGAGVPRNPDLARHWFDVAAEEVPAARERRASTVTAPGPTFEAPAPLGALLIQDKAGPRLALAWSAPPAPEPTGFVVEVVALDGADVGAALSRRATRGSAIEVDLPGSGRAVAWRIRWNGPSGIGATSPWERLSVGGEVAMPAALEVSTVEIRTGRGDGDTLDLVRKLVAALEGQGVEVRLSRLDDGPIESAVTAIAADGIALAEDIAGFLPALTAEDVELAVSDTAEADVVVSIGSAAADGNEAVVPLARSRTSP